MLSLDAEEWKNFEGGYRFAYDASVPLKRLESSTEPDEKMWNELFEELYHQGDVGIASYAAVSQIYRIYRQKEWLDFRLPSFAATVERARLNNHNPKLPDGISHDYFESLHKIAGYCLECLKEDLDKTFSRSVLLLNAVLMKDIATYDLLEAIPIGEEEKALKLFYEDL